MYGSLLLIICSIIYSFCLFIVYKSKKHIETIENKIFSFLIIINFIGLFLELSNYFVVINYEQHMLLTHIISKLYLVYLLIFIMTFTYYTIYISFKKEMNNRNDSKNTLISISQKIIYCTFFLCLILIAFLPIKFNNINGIYSYGPSISVVYIISTACILISILCMLFNFKNIRHKKYYPLFIFLTLGVCAMIFQNKYPGITLITSLETFIVYLMYFTIENPDVKMIEQLNIAKDAADKANKAKTEFLSSMSHEIRTPLNAIVGFSECMLSSKDLNETKEFAKDVVDASQNLLEIVNGILDISKIEANKMEIIPKEYNPREVFNSLCTLIKPRIGEKPIEFKVNISPDLPGVLKGDMGKVKQIILNLLTNAAKYTDKGSIEFNVTCINRQDTKECLLYIAVKDTGRGIKKENIDKLFNKFERIEEDKNTTIEGTGLGLAITKSLAEMMGGKITVSSKYEEGSIFRVYLEQEIISMEIPESKSEEIEIDYSKHEGKRILIVDDSKINLKVANQILKPYNFNVKMVESGYECLELMERETFDLILMDIMMPKMNGVETLRRLKEIEGFDIPVIALTADAIEGTDEKYLNAGFDAYLSKPIDRYELDRVLKKYLGGNEDEE